MPLLEAAPGGGDFVGWFNVGHAAAVGGAKPALEHPFREPAVLAAL